MSEPLSSLASVVSLTGSAIISVKAIANFFHEFRDAPTGVLEWLTMLESLQSTLSDLEQCGRNLDSRYRFSSQFQQRVLSCVTQLQTCTAEVARIAAGLEKSSVNRKMKWDHNTKRIWERAKWAIVGEQKMKRIMERMHLYHFEFEMELLKMLISNERTLPSLPIVELVSETTPSQQQRRKRLRDPMEHSSRKLSRSVTTLDLHLSRETQAGLSTTSRLAPLPVTVDHSCLEIEMAPVMPLLRSHKLVKTIVSSYWSIWTFRALVRAGPVIEARSHHDRKSQGAKYQQTGLGLILSIYLPRCLRSGRGLVLISLEVMTTIQIPPKWSLSFPETLPPNAEIFRKVRAGLLEDVKRLLSLRKTSAKARTIFGTSLLHSASKSGNIELVRLLIQEGADVSAQDEDGDSPLHGAMALEDNYDIARTLIENGADMSSKAIDGRTPFHNIFNNTVSLVLMRDDCIEHMLPDSEGMTITHYLAWSKKSTPEIFQRGHLYDDADLFSAENFGRTCIHFAASRGNVGVLSYLMSRVSLEDVEKGDSQGRTPLHYAAESSRAATVINLLVEKGCNVYAVDGTGRTALHWAARRSNFEAVKKLMAIVGEGALLLADKNGRRPSQEVCRKIAPTLYKYLKDLEASWGMDMEQRDTAQLRHSRAICDRFFRFPLVMEALGILSLIFLALIGRPD